MAGTYERRPGLARAVSQLEVTLRMLRKPESVTSDLQRLKVALLRLKNYDFSPARLATKAWHGMRAPVLWSRSR